MQKKFECKNCSNQFEADDQGFVVCPHCHSDNVEPVHFRLPLWILHIGLVIIFIGLLVAGFFLWPQKINNGGNHTEEEEEDTTTNLTDTTYYDYKIDIPPTVDVTEPEYDGKNYTVKVKASGVPSNMKFYYVRLNHFGKEKEVLQKSEDGHFSDIPYNEESGNSYDFAIMDAHTNTLICDPVPVTGFVPQITIDENKKMTIEQLQQLIDNNDDLLLGTGENDFLAPDYKLIFEGLAADEEKPQTFSQIKERIIFGIWSKITVTKISYDEKNRINSICIKVKIQ